MKTIHKYTDRHVVFKYLILEAMIEYMNTLLVKKTEMKNFLLLSFEFENCGKKSIKKWRKT